MTSKPFSLNKPFKELLQRVEGTSIKRKELIQLATSTTELNLVQSTRFIAKNVNILTTKNLITASGERNARTYHFSDSLLILLDQKTCDSKPNDVCHTESEVRQQETLLKIEEAKTSTELKMILGEIEAYRDFLTKYPANRQIIQKLLHQTKEQSTQLYGRLNALKKVIQETNMKSDKAC
ncbi:hypothetical protein M3I01_001490 [Marinomonas sp. RSW2]|uniref:Uncharacterized protein n=1 Tax=Marinomonas maritima TaxID=2940935 RepID=A0ABT5W9U5_9GAMM|nr:hypothetical protein [Marinomonas maritima]MDE8601601.1 hypothetical protein [Marinomonas maritima]